MVSNGAPASKTRNRVTGGQLGAFVGRDVCLLARVSKGESGNTIQVKDNSVPHAMNVRMTEPISENLTGRIVEIEGKVQDKFLIQAESMTIFTEEMSNTFDMNAYNEAIKTIHSIPGPANPLTFEN